MVIIKKGSKKTEKWIGKCKTCYSVVAAETKELMEVNFGDYKSDYEDWAWERCPQCGARFSSGICFHREGSKSANRDLES